MHKKLQVWKEGLLSYGGKQPLMNSALSSILIYIFSIKKIPKGILRKVDQIRSHFLWYAGAKKKDII